jgi:hypothetical protein
MSPKQKPVKPAAESPEHIPIAAIDSSTPAALVPPTTGTLLKRFSRGGVRFFDLSDDTPTPFVRSGHSFPVSSRSNATRPKPTGEALKNSSE